MRSALIISVLAVSLAGCGGDRTEAHGGISGTVRSGPTCPVETPESPCPPAVWTGTVRATDPQGHLFETQTDADGNYTLHLAPGVYTVVAVTSGGPPNGVPAGVTVSATVVDLDLEVDTGIR